MSQERTDVWWVKADWFTLQIGQSEESGWEHEDDTRRVRHHKIVFLELIPILIRSCFFVQRLPKL